MSYTPYASLPSFIKKQHKLLNGSISVRDIMDSTLDEISKRNPVIKAFVSIDDEGARTEANASDSRYRDGKPLSVLDGCPFAVKDMINTVKLPTQMNSPLYAGWYAPVDASCVYSLRQAGAIVIGKTVTTSFAAGHTNDTRNPHNLQHTPGGSSSGSGAAVGAGLVPIALGTQTRGSLLRPASFCGATGFKPSLNTIHSGGIHPLSPTLDHIGLIAASVLDAWAATWIMAKTQGGTSGHKSLDGNPDKLEPEPIKRLALLEFGEWTDVGAETISGVETVINVLTSERCNIRGIKDDKKLEALEKELVEIIDTESVDILAYEMEWPFNAYPTEKLDSRIIDLLNRRRSIKEEHYHQMLKKRESLKQRAAALTGHYDAFLTLAATGPAPLGNKDTGSRHYQVPWTYLGLPAFSLPLLEAREMPVGLQLMGFADQDHRLARQALWLSSIFLKNS